MKIHYTVVTMTPIRGGAQVYTGASRSFDSLSEAKAHATSCYLPSDSHLILKSQTIKHRDGKDERIVGISIAKPDG